MLDPVPYDLSKVTLINNTEKERRDDEWVSERKNFKLIYATPQLYLLFLKYAEVNDLCFHCFHSILFSLTHSHHAQHSSYFSFHNKLSYVFPFFIAFFRPFFRIRAVAECWGRWNYSHSFHHLELDLHYVLNGERFKPKHTKPCKLDSVLLV